MKLVISAFPAVGKSTIFKEAAERGLKPAHVLFNDFDKEYQIQVPAGDGIPVFDSDSSKFDKAFFPTNYVQHIKNTLEALDDVIILVSSHEQVREMMRSQGIDYVLAYPQRELKEEYIQRYKDRGNAEGFIGMMENSWNKFIDSCEEDPTETKIVLGEGEFLGQDYLTGDLSQIVGMENMNDDPDWFHKSLKQAIVETSESTDGQQIDFAARIQRMEERRQGPEEVSVTIVDVNAGPEVTNQQTIPTDNPEPSVLNTPESLEASTATAVDYQGGVVDTGVPSVAETPDDTTSTAEERNPMVDPDFVETGDQDIPRSELIEAQFDIQGDIETLEKVVVLGNDEDARAGVEGLEDNGSILTAAAEDIKTRYGEDIEPTISGLEGFLDTLKSGLEKLLGKKKEKPTKQQVAMIKKYIHEAETAFALYGSEKWQSEQKFINVGKTKLQVPGIFEKINSVGDIETILKLINKRVVDTADKYFKNDEQRVRAAIKIFNAFKGKPEDTPITDVDSQLPIKPEALTGGVKDSGITDIDVKTKSLELPVLNKDAIKEVTKIVDMLIDTRLYFIKREEAYIDVMIPEDDFYESKFWNKHSSAKQTSAVWDAGTCYGDVPEFEKISNEYSAKMLSIAKFLEQWVLASVK